jgi:hypothetical protein
MIRQVYVIGRIRYYYVSLVAAGVAKVEEIERIEGRTIRALWGDTHRISREDIIRQCMPKVSCAPDIMR